MAVLNSADTLDDGHCNDQARGFTPVAGQLYAEAGIHIAQHFIGNCIPRVEGETYILALRKVPGGRALAEERQTFRPSRGADWQAAAQTITRLREDGQWESWQGKSPS